MAIEFSTEVRLGDIGVLLGFIAVGFSTYYKIKGRQDIQDVKFGYMEKDIEKVKDIAKVNQDIIEEQNNINGQITYLKYRIGEKPDGEYDNKGHRRVGQ